MKYELKRIIPAFVIALALIRFWIEIVTTTIFENSNLVNQINNNKIGFHHYQLGLVIILIAIVLGKLNAKSGLYINLALGLGLALFLDQYTFFLSLFGIRVPFEYRSQTDYMVIVLAIVGLVIYWKYLEKTTNL